MLMYVYSRHILVDESTKYNQDSPKKLASSLVGLALLTLKILKCCTIRMPGHCVQIWNPCVEVMACLKRIQKKVNKTSTWP